MTDSAAPTKRYFDDLPLNVWRESSSCLVSEDDIVAFARSYDPQYFHADIDAARESRFGSVIASGIHVMALWRRLDHEIAHDIAWICGVAWEDVRWKTALRAGDSIRAHARCIDKRISKTDPTRGVVRFEYRLLNQRDEEVWSCVSVNLIERQPAGAH